MKNRLLSRLERKKFCTPRFFILLFCLIVAQIAINALQCYPIDRHETLYKEMITKWQGGLTPEKGMEIEREHAFREETIAVHDQMVMDYMSGKIKKDAFVEHNRAYEKAVYEKQAFDRVYSKYQYFLQKEEQKNELEATLMESLQNGDAAAVNRIEQELKQFDVPQQFFYDSGWQKIIGNSAMDFALVFFLLLLVFPYLLQDYETNLADMVNVSYHRNHLVRLKTSNVLLFMIITGVINQCAVMGTILYGYPLPAGRAALQSLEFFADCPYALTLQDGFVLIMAAKLVGLIALLLVMCVIALAFKKVFTAAVIYIVLLFPLYLIRDSLPGIINFTSMPHLISGNLPLADVEFYNIGNYAITSSLLSAVWAICLIALCILAEWLLCKKYYHKNVLLAIWRHWRRA